MKNALNLKVGLFVAVLACLFIPVELVANPDTGDELLKAAQKGDTDTIETLLDRGVDVNVEDKLGNTPLFYAAKIGDTPTLDLLLEHRAHIDNQNKAGATPLMIAAKYGHEHIITNLLEKGANPSITNNRGTTAARIAKAYEHHTIANILTRAERRAGGLS